MVQLKEVYISVDVETAGPYPRKYALLSIGACVVDHPEQTFYIELKPTSMDFTREAMDIHGLELEQLAVSGTSPDSAMHSFAEWVQAQVPEGVKPVFVAFNAPFDWMFVNDYFLRYLGSNPFGYSALDIKAYYMGMVACGWKQTSMTVVAARYLDQKKLTHNALEDALDQAKIFHGIIQENNMQDKGAIT
jgi:ribonuclease T